MPPQPKQATEIGSASSGVKQHTFAEACGVKRAQERPELGQSDALLLLCCTVTLFFLPILLGALK